MKKKLIPIVLAIICALCCAFALVACDEPDNKATAVVAVTSVTLNQTALTLTVGDEETLTATVAPDDATNKDIRWTSSNTQVATVDKNGNVVAVAQGTAVISAAADGKSDDCTVTVNDVVTDAFAGKTFVCYDVACRSDVYGEDSVKDTEDRTREYNVGSTLVFNNDGTFTWTIKTSSQSGTYEVDGDTITLIYSSPAGYKVTMHHNDGELTMEAEAMKIITCYYLRLQTV